MAELDELQRQLLGKIHSTHQDNVVVDCESSVESTGSNVLSLNKPASEMTIPVSFVDSKSLDSHQNVVVLDNVREGTEHVSPLETVQFVANSTSTVTEETREHSVFSDTSSIHSSLSASDVDQENDLTLVTSMEVPVSEPTSVRYAIAATDTMTEVDAAPGLASSPANVDNNEDSVRPLCSVAEHETTFDELVNTGPVCNAVANMPNTRVSESVKLYVDPSHVVTDCEDSILKTGQEELEPEVVTASNYSSSSSESEVEAHLQEAQPVEEYEQNLDQGVVEAIDHAQNDSENETDHENGILEHQFPEHTDQRTTLTQPNNSKLSECGSKPRLDVSAQR